MLTAVVLSHNDASDLPRCLSSLKFCDHILVVDDQSTDTTRQVADQFKAKVISHPLNANFSAQRNFSLSQVHSGWVFFVDSDEQVSPELAREISESLENPSQEGFFITRIDVLWGRTLTHGDSRSQLLRLAKVGSGHWFGRVHETWQIKGSIGYLSHPLLHFPHPSVADFVSHVNLYSSMRAEELQHNGSKTHLLSIIFAPPVKFIDLYIFKLGFLDGTPGLISAMIMAFYSFLVRGKLFLLTRP